MAASAIMVKRLGGLHPTDDDGTEALRKVPEGELVRVKMTRPRHGKHHRLFWALMHLVYENLPDRLAARYPREKDMVRAIKITVGLREETWMPDGTVHIGPGSLAYVAMDQAEFSEFFERVADLIARDFLPGVTSNNLRREVEHMIGIAA